MKNKQQALKEEQQAFDAMLRDDLPSFVAKVFETLNGGQVFFPSVHIDLVCDHLVRAYRGEITRLNMNLPPRNLKSMCVSIAFVAWALGHDPTLRIICVSYSDELAAKLARDCRAIMMSDWYRRIFPGTRLSRKKSAVGDFETTRGGGRFSTSVGGSLTGRGGDIVIIDDPIKPKDAESDPIRTSVNQWFDNTLYSRLDDKRSGIFILIMQRVHVDDLVAHVQEKEPWEHLCLPAIAEIPERYTMLDGRVFERNVGDVLHPAREPLDVLMNIKATLGSFYFQSQYQQCPVPMSGNLIKWDWFQTFVDPPQGGWIAQSWDTAISEREGADWSVCTTWMVCDKTYYLLDVHRDRMDFPTLKKMVVDLKQLYGARDVLIEDTGAATGLIQQFKLEGPFRPIAIKPEGSKADRMLAQSAVIEAGNVFIPHDEAWLEDFQSELLAFPMGKHDDQVDSMSQFLNWISRPRATIEVLHVLI